VHAGLRIARVADAVAIAVGVGHRREVRAAVARVAEAVAVPVVLVGVRDVGAVVVGVGDAVTVAIAAGERAVIRAGQLERAARGQRDEREPPHRHQNTSAAPQIAMPFSSHWSR